MKHTITARDEIERLFHEGRRSSCALIAVFVLPSQASDGAGRLLFAAGKKLGSAPMRSRSKRVLRACATELGAPWAGFDVALTARKGLATAPHAEVLAQMCRCLERAGVL